MSDDPLSMNMQPILELGAVPSTSSTKLSSPKPRSAMASQGQKYLRKVSLSSEVSDVSERMPSKTESSGPRTSDNGWVEAGTLDTLTSANSGMLNFAEATTTAQISDIEDLEDLRGSWWCENKIRKLKSWDARVEAPNSGGCSEVLRSPSAFLKTKICNFLACLLCLDSWRTLPSHQETNGETSFLRNSIGNSIRALQSEPKSDEASPSEAPHLVKRERRHLVLNMDINKTVLMTDSTNGKSAEQVVNETLANTSWGTEVDGEWVLGVSEPSVLRPEPHMVSYVEWVESYHPGRENNDIRNTKNGSFTYPGGPGERMEAFARNLIASLKMPDGSEMRLIPSFFQLLINLKSNRRSFCLCFRTFGLDLLDVAKELNMFCEGNHPLFPGVVMDGSDGDPDYRLPIGELGRYGTFFRDCENGELALIMGTIEQPGEGAYRKEPARLEFYDRFLDVTVIRGQENVQTWLWDKCMMSGTLGVRDYFQYWKSKGMTSHGGKPLFYSAVRSTKVHQLFFDDNIRYGDAYIVNAIDVREPQRFQWITPLLETHLCRAEPLESIKDPEYFVKQVERLEVGYERKLAARERLCRLLRKAARKAKAQARAQENNSVRAKATPATRDEAYRENGGQDVDKLPKYDAWRCKRRGSWLSSGEDESVIEQLVFSREGSKASTGRDSSKPSVSGTWRLDSIGH